MFDASNNRLESLPAEIGALTKLEEFRLSGNLLRELPKTIGNCSRLEVRASLPRLSHSLLYSADMASFFSTGSTGRPHRFSTWWVVS